MLCGNCSHVKFWNSSLDFAVAALVGTCHLTWVVRHLFAHKFLGRSAHPGIDERLITGCCTSQASAPIQVALGADLGIHITAHPKPSPQTQFVLTPMSEQKQQQLLYLLFCFLYYNVPLFLKKLAKNCVLAVIIWL